MAYLLVFLGIILVAVTGKHAWRQALEKEMGNQQQQSIDEVMKRVAALEKQLSSLKETVVGTPNSWDEASGILKMEILNQISNLERKLDNFGEHGVKPKDAEKEDFLSHFKTAEKESLFCSVRAAYASGKSITEIAEEFGRGKGEIELILNLQK